MKKSGMEGLYVRFGISISFQVFSKSMPDITDRVRFCIPWVTKELELMRAYFDQCTAQAQANKDRYNLLPGDVSDLNRSQRYVFQWSEASICSGVVAAPTWGHATVASVGSHKFYMPKPSGVNPDRYVGLLWAETELEYLRSNPKSFWEGDIDGIMQETQDGVPTLIVLMEVKHRATADCSDCYQAQSIRSHRYWKWMMTTHVADMTVNQVKVAGQLSKMLTWSTDVGAMQHLYNRVNVRTMFCALHFNLGAIKKLVKHFDYVAWLSGDGTNFVHASKATRVEVLNKYHFAVGYSMEEELLALVILTICIRYLT
jgi:hypothetical protein